MKLLLFAVAIAAVAAEPEADSFFPYTNYGSYYSPSIYRSAYSAGVYSSPYTTYGSFPYTSYYRGLYKREAEAESDPELVYTNGNFHTNARNLAKGVHTQYAAARPGAFYESLFPHYRNTYTTHAFATHPYTSAYYGIYKREAEAESDADSFYPLTAYSSLYNPVYRSGYSAYSAAYSPYTAYRTIPYSNYYGLYKREAEGEAEADPAYLVSPYYRAGYTAGFSPYRAAYTPYTSTIYPGFRYSNYYGF